MIVMRRYLSFLDLLLFYNIDLLNVRQPDPTQRTLMIKTAQHLLTSPNPTQLEARILANHGKDGRFAFLRGRWGKVWREVKEGVLKEKEGKEKGGGLGLGEYGSDSDSDEEKGEEGDKTKRARE